MKIKLFEVTYFKNIVLCWCMTNMIYKLYDVTSRSISVADFGNVAGDAMLMESALSFAAVSPLRLADQHTQLNQGVARPFLASKHLYSASF
jgi:hypothetical protein